MKGSYLAAIIESDMLREKRMKSLCVKKKKYIDEKCKTCANRKTDLCHITEDIEGNTKCINYKKEDLKNESKSN